MQYVTKGIIECSIPRTDNKVRLKPCHGHKWPLLTTASTQPDENPPAQVSANDTPAVPLYAPPTEGPACAVPLVRLDK